MLALPEIFVFSMACVILIVDLFLSERTRFLSYYLTQATLIIAAVLTYTGMEELPVSTFNGMFIADTMADILKLATYLIIFFVFVYSRDYIRDRGMFRGEYFVLGLFDTDP